ncbi:PIG-L family deacetylase [Allocoprobacillus halotolerans]|uniref:PIG-L family deacetylase n=1 Tax=Allocoprobacillus halotolerans TaxID=2944914 RepID=A0ABY5HZ51_9FIRM|nr:PIG-L family deacetylase [Allocoprobacillus halotolerans]UTY38331.1 PIG-L family deacetylase [Allocoprobacillus halotolerans]
MKSTNLDLYEQDVGKLDVELSDNQFIDNLKYTVDDNEILQIDNQGNYKALKAGTTHISVQVEGTNQKVDCYVHIFPFIKIQDIQLKDVPQYDLYPGMKFSLKFNILPEGATQKDIHIVSSNSDIFEVNNQGNIEVKGIGEATIKISVNKTSVSKEVKLKSIEKPKVDETLYCRHNDELKIETHKGYQLSYSHIEKNKDIIYESENNDIASVSPEGLLYAKRPGYTVIKWRVGNKTYRCQLIVKCDNGLINLSDLSQAGINESHKLMIVAHPDDETLWGGGHLLDGGWFVVVLTNGYNNQRVKELTNALSISHTHFIILNYPDLKSKKVKDDWNYVQKGMSKDIETLLKYKQWDQVVTHNPKGEYGHIHHKMTNQLVKKLAINLKIYDKLYYFGKFYSNDGKFYGNPKMPDGLKSTYSGEKLKMKNMMIDKFTSQKKLFKNIGNK